jgi:chromosome segregation ATPase
MSGVAIKSDCRKNVGAVQVFATAHHDFHLTNQTAQQSGFHSANMMIEQEREETMQGTVDAIYQLATATETATASYRVTVATLTTTNAKLATKLEAAQAQIAQLKDEIAALKDNIKPAWQGQQPIKTTNNDSYCWYHGY